MRGRPSDLRNLVFGKLTVVSKEPSAKSGGARWLCQCTCGQTNVVYASNLTTGNVKSCGCSQGHEVRPMHELFWAKVDTSSPDGCWPWLGVRHKFGYGQFGMRVARGVPYRMKQAHRVAWELTNGLIPVGMVICHRCDNRACCRPDHLFVGTQNDNIADMVAKGRQRSPSGLDHWKRKLTLEDVAKIRARLATGGERYIDIAKDFNIGQTAVQKIKAGINWKPKEEANRT